MVDDHQKSDLRMFLFIYYCFPLKWGQKVGV